MTNLLKKLTFIMVTALLIAFLLGPPLSFASKLPTVCNIFHKKMTDKAGPCGHRAMFSKIQDKSFEIQAVLFFNVDSETSHFLIIQNNPSSFSFPFGSNAQSNPLRC
jgi:hypothetical protein